MCGRFNIISDPRAWIDAFEAVAAEGAFDSFAPRYNISPSEPPLPPGSKRSTPQRVTVIPSVFRRGDELVADQLIWPLIPMWAKGEVPKYSTANARSEDMATKNAYRNAWKRGQRCLIYATGFFEWQAVPGEQSKRPWNIRLRDAEAFAFGGLWESSRSAGGSEVLSCTIVTLPANSLMREIHNAGRNRHRMPLIFPESAQRAWLDVEAGAASDLIRALPSEDLEAWPISRAVNNPNRDDASILEHRPLE